MSEWPSKSELESWKNSHTYVCDVLDKAELPDDCGIAVEYQLHPTRKRIDFIIPRCQLTMGAYTLAFYLSDKFNNIVDWIDNICTLYVEAGDFYGTGKVHRRGLGHFIADYEIREV